MHNLNSKENSEISEMKGRKKRLYKKLAMIMVVGVLGIVMFAFPAFATSSISAPTVMGNLISLMCSMFKYVGVALFVWAIIQFILATKRSDADSKSDAIQTAVCGIALMAVSAIVNSMGLAGSGVVDKNVTDGMLDGSTP